MSDKKRRSVKPNLTETSRQLQTSLDNDSNSHVEDSLLTSRRYTMQQAALTPAAEFPHNFNPSTTNLTPRASVSNIEVPPNLLSADQQLGLALSRARQTLVDEALRQRAHEEVNNYLLLQRQLALARPNPFQPSSTALPTDFPLFPTSSLDLANILPTSLPLNTGTSILNQQEQLQRQLILQQHLAQQTQQDTLGSLLDQSANALRGILGSSATTAVNTHDVGSTDDFAENTGQATKGGSTVTDTFPMKLHRMLTEVEAEGKTDIISFHKDGCAFAIHDRAALESDILPRYFRHGRLTSLQRQLCLYGFQRIASGPDTGAYYHKFFLKSRPELCTRIMRQTSSRSNKKLT